MHGNEHNDECGRIKRLYKESMQQCKYHHDARVWYGVLRCSADTHFARAAPAVLRVAVEAVVIFVLFPPPSEALKALMR